MCFPEWLVWQYGIHNMTCLWAHELDLFAGIRLMFLATGQVDMSEKHR